jgi:RHS repeat-associated protein
VFGDLRYAYDVHGNVTSRKKGAHEEIEFTWNAGHRLTQAKVTRKGTTQTTRYEYDALGRRTRKIDAFGVTEFLWDGDLMIESRRNNKQALFLFEPYSFVPLATVQDEKTYWYQCDQIGAPQELTDQEGNIVWAADYTVWGEATLRKTGTDGAARYARRSEPPPSVLEQPFRFQGQQFDEETGLHYNYFRDYDPATGRYLQPDPIGLGGGINLYRYANANPIIYSDHNGLWPRPGFGFCELFPSLCNGSPPAPPPGERIQPPGDCSTEEYNTLIYQKDEWCDKPRRCHWRNSCDYNRERLNNAQQCMLARWRIMSKCFKGGDVRHYKEIRNVINDISSCYHAMDQRGCDPSSPLCGGH